MSFWKSLNIAASCILGIVVFRITYRRAKESGLFEKKETDE